MATIVCGALECIYNIGHSGEDELTGRCKADVIGIVKDVRLLPNSHKVLPVCDSYMEIPDQTYQGQAKNGKQWVK